MTSDELAKNRADLERMENQYAKLGVTGEASTTKINKGFGKLTKNTGRFLFNMFAVGSVFALVARASRSYMETNEEANASMELTTNVMGQMLAPAMKTIINLTQYVIIGMSELIRMFTGFDALAKATTKDLTKASKSADKFNKSLLPMDEITNITDNADDSITNLADDFSALTDFKSKIEEVRALFEKWNIQAIVDKLKGLAQWLWDNRDAVIAVGIALGTVFAVSKIAGWVSNLGILKTALLALASNPIVAGISAILTIFIALGVEIDKVNKKYSNLANAMGTGGGSSGSSTFGNSKGFGAGGAKFANGNVATRPTFAMFGEYAGARSNPEITTPQSIMKDTMIEAFAQIIPAMQSNGGKGDVILNVNGREFARATYGDYQNEAKRVGSSNVIRRA